MDRPSGNPRNVIERRTAGGEQLKQTKQPAAAEPPEHQKEEDNNMYKVIDKHDNENVIFETREEAEGMIRVMVKWRNATKKAAEPRDSRKNYIIVEQ